MARSGLRYAKLTRPRLHAAVARTRLFSHLDGVRSRGQAAWVVGPPGSGKTTLVASWLDARKLQGIWYQLTADDADLASFFLYLTRAAQVGRVAKLGLPRPTPDRLRDPSTYGRRFFRELYCRMPPSSVLVFDNYQELPVDSELLTILSNAISELPETMTLVVIGRADPPLDHARLLANGLLATIGWDDLRLTLDETREIARSRGTADDTLTRLLHELSGGWATGLTLLLERAALDRAQPLGAGSVDAVFDYFAAEIFRTVSPEVQSFLIATAHLPWVSADLARRLTGDPEAREILEHLHRRSLFTHRVATGPAIYSYHALFRGFLLKQAEAVLTAKQRQAMMATAASLMDEHGDWDTAVALYQQMHAWDRIIEIIRVRAVEMLAQGRWRTLVEWFRKLPDAVVERDPWVRYWAGMSMAAVDVMVGRAELERAFALFQRQGDLIGQMLCATEILRAFFMEFHSFERVDPWIDLLSELVCSASEMADAETELRIYSGLLCALVSQRPAHPMIDRCVERTYALLQQQPNSNLALTAAISLCVYATMRGRISLAADLAALLRPHLQSEGLSPVLKTFWIGFYGYVRYVAGDSVNALILFEEAEKLGDDYGLAPRIGFIRAWHAYCLRRLGRLDQAESVAREIERHATDVGTRRNITWLFALIERTRGRLVSAVRLGIEALSGVKISECVLHGAQHLQLAEMLIESGSLDLARTWLEDAKSRIVGTFSEQAWRPVILLFEALLSQRQGDMTRCQGGLREALRSLRSSEELVFVGWFRYLLGELLPIALEADIDTELVHRLIRDFRIAPKRPYPKDWPWPVRIYTLGRFEVLIDGEPMRFTHKTPHRLILLLKALIALGGREVAEQKLLDLFWAEELGDAAAHALTVALHRLRRLLGSPDAVRTADGKVSLDEHLVWTDAGQLDQILNRSEANSHFASALLELYRGDFLAAEPDAAWAISLRERLRGKFIYHLERAGLALESSGQWPDAIALYLGGLDADPLSESFYVGLMRCYAAQDRRADALGVYRRMRQQLSLVLGVKPSRSSEALARDLQSH